ncbi:MAG: glutamate--tRNA ligase [Chitinivibrionales bacterium]|nr:glutamate--tRNA ligase [Chitinivibrionales bacterium]
MTTDVRVRFAPSPTGYLHVGAARTALFDYLYARHMDGTFILRIEDTDRSRLDENALGEILASLRWLGLDWDEGPEVGGPCGPYVQSERTDLYRKHVNMLLESGRAYRCFCSPERLRELREQQEKSKDTRVGYDRKCRGISPEQSQRMADEGTPYVIRFVMPDNRGVSFDDIVRGRIEYRTDVLEDTVLLKSDGFPTYHLANVVDDYHMRISHVLRGEEWIASTPLHLLMYEAFGWDPPRFAHVPVILSPDGGKLSKRKGAASVMDFQRAGFLPDAMVNFLALVGWSPGDDRERMSRDELIQAFELKRVNPKAAVFDEQKLEWLNGQYLQDCPVEQVAGTVLEGWRERGWIGENDGLDNPRLRAIIEQMKSRARRVTDIAPASVYFFEDPTEYDQKGAKKHFKPGVDKVLTELAGLVEQAEPFDAATLEEAYRKYAEQHELGAGKVIHPTRLAISGVSFGPGLFEIMELLGKETVARRMRHAAGTLQAQ